MADPKVIALLYYCTASYIIIIGFANFYDEIQLAKVQDTLCFSCWKGEEMVYRQERQTYTHIYIYQYEYVKTFTRFIKIGKE